MDEKVDAMVVVNPLFDALRIIKDIIEHERTIEDTGETEHRFRCVFCGRRGSQIYLVDHAERCPIEHGQNYLFKHKGK